MPNTIDQTNPAFASLLDSYHSGTPVDKSMWSAGGTELDAFLARHRIAQLVTGQAVSNKSHAMRLLAQQGELRRIRQHPDCPRFDVIKGLPLAARHYHNVQDRHVGDIDILCDTPHDVLKLERTLSSLGYHPTQSHQNLGLNPRSAFFQNSSPSNWDSPNRSWEIEIHWQRPNRGKFPAFMQQGSFWESVELPLGTERILRPAPLMLYLICHGGRSAWRRLKWIVDLDRISRSMSTSDWQEFKQLAEQSDWRRAVSVTADVCLHWLPNSPLTEQLQAIKQPYPPRLLATCVKHQQTKNALEFSFFPSMAHNLLISQSSEYRRCILLSSFTKASNVHYPSGPDWLLWPIAFATRPLYYAADRFAQSKDKG